MNNPVSNKNFPPSNYNRPSKPRIPPLGQKVSNENKDVSPQQYNYDYCQQRDYEEGLHESNSTNNDSIYTDQAYNYGDRYDGQAYDYVSDVNEIEQKTKKTEKQSIDSTNEKPKVAPRPPVRTKTKPTTSTSSSSGPLTRPRPEQIRPQALPCSQSEYDTPNSLPILPQKPLSRSTSQKANTNERRPPVPPKRLSIGQPQYPLPKFPAPTRPIVGSKSENNIASRQTKIPQLPKASKALPSKSTTVDCGTTSNNSYGIAISQPSAPIMSSIDEKDNFTSLSGQQVKRPPNAMLVYIEGQLSGQKRVPLSDKSERRYIKEGPIQKMSRRGAMSQYIHLFNDIMLISDPSKIGVGFRVKRVYDLSVTYIEEGGGSGNQSTLTIYSSAKSSVILFRNNKELEEWFNSLKPLTCQTKPKNLAPVWVPDHEIAACPLCLTNFTMFRRKHHCRACGGLVCDDCSKSRLRIEKIDAETLQRVCDPCTKTEMAMDPNNLGEQPNNSKHDKDKPKTEPDIDYNNMLGGFIAKSQEIFANGRTDEEIDVPWSPRKVGDDADTHSLCFENHTFELKDFMPESFARIRLLHNIDTASYVGSLDGGRLKGGPSAGKSGAYFFFTKDKKFIIKTLTFGESQYLRNITHEYCTYMVKHKDSLVQRFFGHYRLQGPTSTMFFVVMNNLFPESSDIQEVYDLKGSIQGRAASAEENARKLPVWKDLDFAARNRSLVLDRPTMLMLRLQLDLDTQFLMNRGIMDYSFLVGIHFNKETKSNVGEEWVKKLNADGCSAFQRDNGGLCSADGTAIYYIGVIDILQTYNTQKILETALKSVPYKHAQISSVGPEKYQPRFFAYVVNLCEEYAPP